MIKIGYHSLGCITIRGYCWWPSILEKGLGSTRNLGISFVILLSVLLGVNNIFLLNSFVFECHVLVFW